jgi:hypothetical protein
MSERTFDLEREAYIDAMIEAGWDRNEAIAEWNGTSDEQACAASLFGWLADKMAREPSMNEYLSYPEGTWESEEAYVKWKRSNPPGTKPAGF